MKYLITTCSKEKRQDEKLLPALERYLDPRIKQVYNKSKDLKVGFLILSGKYGILDSDELIPYYDQILLETQVSDMVERVLPQLKKFKVTELVVYGKNEQTNPSWRPYYEVLRISCEKLKIDYSEEIIITPKVFALVGDFGAGKTSLRRMFSQDKKYFIGNDLFSYLHTEDFINLELYRDKSKAYRLNYFRDCLLEKSGKEIAIHDEDILELLAYEFSCKVRDDSDIYESLKEELYIYRNNRPYFYPVGYIDLLCPIKESEKRIALRDATERLTPDYFKQVLTKLSYRHFYDEVFKFIPENRKLRIDTTSLSLGEVYNKSESFIQQVLSEDYYLLNVFIYLENLNLELMKREVLAEYAPRE